MLTPFPFEILHNWYKKNGRHNLPWRDYEYDSKTLGYRVWLAEIMLQQTQVERVKDYFYNILEVFPTIEDLAKTDYEEFFPYYKGLGYYSRARNMLKTAKKIVEDFGGVFPKKTEKLLTLPGVGPYTAQAIRAFAYDTPTLSFDTNLEKIFSRYYFGNKFQKLTKQEKEKILNDFKKSNFSARDINNALMDYGAIISNNSLSSIDWEDYPIKTSKFYKTRGELEPITKKKVSNFSTKEAQVIAILHENHKIYFSPLVIPAKAGISKENIFSPFLVGKNTGNPRKMIQEYFLDNYNLEVSVRPPEIKSYKHEKPYLICYTQIQSGKYNFSIFEGIKVRGNEEGIIEKMEF